MELKEVLFFLILVFGLSIKSKACFCDLKTDYKTKEDLKEYSFIALVRILKIDTVSSDTQNPIHTTKFEIIEKFKGDFISEILVHGGHYSLKGTITSCDLGESANEEWLIFAYDDKHLNKLAVDLCTRTTRYKKSDGYKYKGYGDEISHLEKLRTIFISDYKRQLKYGEVAGYYNNGQIELEENYINNVLEGKRSLWYPNGQLESVQYYKNGEREDLAVWYSRYGQLLAKEKFENGHPIDTAIRWYEIDTTKYKIKSFARFNKITIDSATKLFLSTQVRSRYIYDATGAPLYYYGFQRNGVLTHERIYDKSINKITSRFYHNNGMLKSEHYDLDGKNNSIYREWNDSGKQIKYWEYNEAGEQVRESILISKE